MPEAMLEDRRIDEYFGEDFFRTEFWLLFVTILSSLLRHSAMEMRRRSDRSGRAPLFSPGRPVVAGRDVTVASDVACPYPYADSLVRPRGPSLELTCLCQATRRFTR